MYSSAARPKAALEIRRRLPEDSAALVKMYAEIFGPEEAERNRLRWRWQYEQNPHCPAEGPEIWVAREGDQILGQYATMPVALKVKDRIVRGSWGMDVMVRTDLQRTGVGSQLFLYWNRQVDASLGLGLSVASYTLFKKLRWEDVGPVPCYTRILNVQALLARRLGDRTASLLAPLARALVGLAFPTRPATEGGERVEVAPLEGSFGPAFDRLWERAAPAYDFVVERRASYLEWKYRKIPFVSYQVFQALRGGELAGYVVVRVVEREGARLGLLVDLFASPDDSPAVDSLVDRAIQWGRDEGVGRIQTFTFDRRLRARLRRKGFFEVQSPMQFCLRINTGHVEGRFFRDTSRWHVAFGDSDQDRHP